MEPFYVFLGVTVIIALVLFLPALFELKKPKDLGPRKIVGFKTGVLMQSLEKESFMQPVDLPLVAAVDSLTNLDV
jgi:hypothetical protein